MKTTIVVIALLLCCLFATAQNDSIIVKTTTLGSNYFFKGNQLSLKTLERKLKKNPTTYKIVSEGKTDKTFSQIFSFTGGFLVGYSLAQLITTGKLNPYILGSGAAFVGIALPFGSSYEKRLKKAILIYNSELN